ncbi:MAG: WYL domain-containing protein [Cryomorphaceae bacterium]
MPANKYALLRYRIIDRRLRNQQRPFPSKEDLRYACEEALYGSDGEHISMSTIDKDLWAMRNEGELGYYAPIKFSKEYGGYFYENPEYTISELPLNDDDLDAIQTAAQTLFQFKDIPLFKEFDAAIDKILDRMRISSFDENKAVHDVLEFERGVSDRGSEFLGELFKAAKNDLSVKLTYRKFGAADDQLVQLDPYLLKEYGGRWYVIGFEHAKQSMRTYSLDRVTQVYTGDVRFERQASFDTQSFFKHAMGITVTQEEPIEVRLRFSARLAPYVMSSPIHGSQTIEKKHPTGECELSIHVLKTIELLTLVLGYGEDVEVLAPTSLKEEVISTLTTCLKKYSKGDV